MRAVVSTPPRHGKTESLIHGMAWLLGSHPDRQLAYVSYASTFAEDKSRKARQIAQAAGVPISQLAWARKNWRTGVADGGVWATAIAGPMTGQGFHCMIIDDPVKDRVTAESATLRQQHYDWFNDVAYTRLEPTGACLVVQCMAGDTSVLMTDGGEKPLRDVRPGDVVTTFHAGAFTTSRVLNWANQGPDRVYELKMRSGASVKANERHPFLVRRDGSDAWIRVRDLRVGDEIVTASLAGGASGPASLARSMAASTTQRARDCASRTTRRRGGHLAQTVPHQSNTGSDTSSIDTASPPLSSRRSSLDSKACALSVGSPQARTYGLTGATSSASTTTTTQAECVGCFATTAISPSGTERRQTSCPQPRITYVATVDAIKSIADAGVEDVFDIQVEGTENFIANGLVSHNTRWHPDDLAGRLIKDGWECVNLPALDENDEPLWPERWTKAKLLEIRNQLGDYGWTSLYMGQPRSRDGAVFRDVHFYDDAPRGFRASIGVDLAYTAKTQADWSVAVAMAEVGGEFYVLDVKRAQAAPPDFAKSLRTLAASYPGAPMLWYTSSIEREVGSLLRGAADIPLRTKIAKGDKFVRSQPVAAAWNAGKIHIPRSAKWTPQFVEEVCGFTGVNDRHDDQVDALAAAFDALNTARKTPDLRDLATFQKAMPKGRYATGGSHMDDWDD